MRKYHHQEERVLSLIPVLLYDIFAIKLRMFWVLAVKGRSGPMFIKCYFEKSEHVLRSLLGRNGWLGGSAFLQGQSLIPAGWFFIAFSFMLTLMHADFSHLQTYTQ
jgi:hypothetical protein